MTGATARGTDALSGLRHRAKTARGAEGVPGVPPSAVVRTESPAPLPDGPLTKQGANR
jgi:hypothetical protein